MRIVLSLLAFLVMSSVGTAAGPVPAEVVTNQEVENFYRELSNPECDSSPGGSARVPIQELQQLIQPGTPTPQRPAAPRRTRATR